MREVCAARPEVDRPLVAPFEDGLGRSKIYGSEGNRTFESNGLFTLAAL